MEPLVSAIIPVYNRREFLKEAVDSIKQQTYKRIEIIIVDDGSTDEPSCLFKNDKDVKIIRLDHCGLPGMVRNRGALEAGGSYLAFLDSDDLWHPSKIEKQIDFFNNNPEISICHTRETWQRNNQIISQRGQDHQKQGDIFKDALIKCIIGPSTVMIEKIIFIKSGMFCKDIEIAEDYELWLRITARHMVGYIDEPLIIKRAGHPDQLSEKYGHIELFRIKALELNIGSGFFNPLQNNLAVKELRRKIEIYIAGCLKRGKTAEAEYYKNKLKEYPLPG